MELKLEYIVATAIAAVLCGSTAPNVLTPLEEVAKKACKNISPRVRNPIEETVKEIYDSFLITGEMIRRFFYPNNLLNQQYYK